MNANPAGQQNLESHSKDLPAPAHPDGTPPANPTTPTVPPGGPPLVPPAPEAPPIPDNLLAKAPLVSQTGDVGGVFSSIRFTPVQAHFAVNKGSVSYITELIQAGVDLNYYIYGDTPLLLSISKGHQVIAELLSAADRCDVSLTEDMDSRRSPIHVAARNGYTKVVQNIIDRGGNVNVRDALFMTPLHMAAVGGNPSTVQCLLNNGADIAAIDISRRTPLNRAAEYNHLGIIRRLWYAGSDINHRDRFGWTALFHSVACGHHATVEALLECNIDVNLQCDEGETVLHLAAHRLRHSILNRLQSGSDINFYSRTVEMPTQAVHEAISKSCEGMNILHLLLNYGADVNVFNKSGLAPICLAAIVGREDMMRLMIECGLNVYQHISPEDSQQAIEMELRAALDTSMSCYCIENCCDFLRLSPHQQFPSLATLCRTSIRKALVKPINSNVASLPLPAQILNEIRIPTDFHEIRIPTDFLNMNGD